MKKLIFFLSCFITTVSSAATLPSANLTVSPAMGKVFSEFTFDGSSSTNTTGTSSNLQYRFHFGRNTYTTKDDWTDFSWNSIAKFIPQDVGTFYAKMQVRDQSNGAIQTTYQVYRVTGSELRKAQIKVLTEKIYAGEPAEFKLDLVLPSYEDSDDVTARWDFDSDGIFETGFSQRKIVTHIYSFLDVNQTSPTVEIIWPDGKHETIRRFEKYRVSENKNFVVRSPKIVAPILSISPGAKGKDENLIFKLDASRSKISANAWLEWSFDGESFYTDDKIITKKFTSPGKHEVRVRTCFNRANPICAETTEIVEVDRDPTDFRAEMWVQNMASSFSYGFYENYLKATIGEKLRFSANYRDFYGKSQKFQFRWDFDGDGIFDTDFSDSNFAEKTFARAGEFVALVEIRNEEGVSATATKVINIIENTAPRGNFTISSEKIIVGERVRITPKVTDDATYSSRLEIRFDIDGDGVWDSDFRSIYSFEWQFEKVGKITAKMQIRDAGKKVSTISKTFEVFNSEKPKAAVTVSHKYGNTSTVFEFDAGRSVGNNLKYFWDFDYRGKNDILSEGNNIYSAGSRISKIFRTSGEKIIALVVVDNQGNKDKIWFPVYVSLSSVVQE
jgi:hypothetical protein